MRKFTIEDSWRNYQAGRNHEHPPVSCIGGEFELYSVSESGRSIRFKTTLPGLKLERTYSIPLEYVRFYPIADIRKGDIVQVMREEPYVHKINKTHFRVEVADSTAPFRMLEVTAVNGARIFLRRDAIITHYRPGVPRPGDRYILRGFDGDQCLINRGLYQMAHPYKPFRAYAEKMVNAGYKYFSDFEGKTVTVLEHEWGDDNVISFCLQEDPTLRLMTLQRFFVEYIPPGWPDPNAPKKDAETLAIEHARGIAYWQALQKKEANRHAEVKEELRSTQQQRDARVKDLTRVQSDLDVALARGKYADISHTVLSDSQSKRIAELETIVDNFEDVTDVQSVFEHWDKGGGSEFDGLPEKTDALYNSHDDLPALTEPDQFLLKNIRDLRNEVAMSFEVFEDSIADIERGAELDREKAELKAEVKLNESDNIRKRVVHALWSTTASTAVRWGSSAFIAYHWIAG